MSRHSSTHSQLKPRFSFSLHVISKSCQHTFKLGYMQSKSDSLSEQLAPGDLKPDVAKKKKNEDLDEPIDDLKGKK